MRVTGMSGPVAYPEGVDNGSGPHLVDLDDVAVHTPKADVY